MCEPVISVRVERYTIVDHANNRTEILRDGQPWRDYVGDDVLLALAYEVDTLRAQLAAYQEKTQ